MKRDRNSWHIAGAALALLAGTACQKGRDDTSNREISSAAHTQEPQEPQGEGHVRKARLQNAAGEVVGTVTLVRGRGHRVAVFATINFPGAREGFHGIHIHANDNPANGEGCLADPTEPASTHFVSADGHYNPTSTIHGSHGGDLPNVQLLDDGSGVLNAVREIDLDDVVGRAVILHDDVDNHAHVPTGAATNQYTANAADAVTLTQSTGNAGLRIACGLIQ
jgi:Cu-Zn family superoxide dismutase